VVGKVPIYVVEPSVEQFVDEALQQRLGATRDLRAGLNSNRYARVVDHPEHASLIVEVLTCTEEPSPRKEVTLLTGITQLFDKVVTAQLTVGSYTTVLAGQTSRQGGFRVTTWNQAALRASISIMHWVLANHDRLPTPEVSLPEKPPKRTGPLIWIAVAVMVVIFAMMAFW
jgi:hypothetical protein